MPEPIFEKSVRLPLGYSFTARARPSTIKRTAVRLLPWAIYAMLPEGRLARVAFGGARRLSPLMKQKIRRP
ncbi:MAG: hypothetical protein HYX50_01055 [Chloroflexi bacterium]|nr:hypothetical protein [Chloroflexota bacterium]